MSGKSVCVVGGGLSGLTTIKECLDNGLRPTCYELDSDIGGTWKHKDAKTIKNGVTLWANFTCNFSKWGIAFSSHPPNPKEPPYLNKEAMFEYYKGFGVRFGLIQYIHFNTRVVWIRKTADHATTGRWQVFTCPTSEFHPVAGSDAKIDSNVREDLLSRCKSEIYDCVIICSGYYKIPHYPDIPGTSEFKGQIHHSFMYTENESFVGKNVMVVGNRISAMEITADIAKVANQTYLAVRKGMWTMPHVKSRAACSPEQLLSRDLGKNGTSSKAWVNLFDLAAKNKVTKKDISKVSPQDADLVARSCINELVTQIKSGDVQIVGSLSHLTSNEGHFKDGSSIQELEAIVYCTGYGTELSFLDADIIAPNGKMELFKMVFPLADDDHDHHHHSLAFVGVIGLDSPFAIVSELQSRLATRTMAGLHSLPSRKDMKRDADCWNVINWHMKGNFHYLLPGFVLADSIAREIGVYPSFWRLFVRDPLLAFRVWYGGIVGVHYRLLGPGSQWQEARRLCHEQYEQQAQCSGQADGSVRSSPKTCVDSVLKRCLRATLIGLAAGAFSIIFYKQRRFFIPSANII